MSTDRKNRYLRRTCSLFCAALLAATGCGEAGEEAFGGAEGTPAESSGEAGVAAEPEVFGEPGQLAAYDPARAHYDLKIRADQELHEISDMLYGIFFEDINFAADGGLYAEMVQNRSFEFTSLAQGNEKHAWRDVGDITANVVTDDPEGGLNCNNTNYMVLTNSTADTLAGIANRGFLEGMAVEEGKSYRCSLWAKGLEGYDGGLDLAITEDGESIGGAAVPKLTGEWQYYEVLLEPA